MKKRRRRPGPAPIWPLPYRERRFGATLASRAIECRPAALGDPLHCPAARASLPFPVVDGESLREIAELAVGPRIVAKRGPARFNGLCDDFGDRLDQQLKPPRGDLARRPPRVDAR